MGFNQYPKQGSFIGANVIVCFNYDSSKCISGTIVRDDAEDLHRMIIKLEDGRYVLSTECQYSLVKNSKPTSID